MIFRNFFIVIRSYALSSILNVLGLSLAFATAILISIQANYEYGYDNRTANAERIYRVDIQDDEMTTPLMSMPLVEVISTASPHIEVFTIDDMWARNDYLVSIDKVNFTSIHCQQVKPEFLTKMVTPEVVEGSLSAIEDPNVVAIPASVAQNLFGTTTNVVGKVLSIKTPKGINEVTVGAVYNDFQRNSIFYNSIYRKFTDDYHNAGKWDNGCVNLYIMLDNPDNLAAVNNEIDTAIKRAQPEFEFKCKITAIRDLYFTPKVAMESSPKGNQTTTNVMIIVAVMVVLIACVNFVNFSTAIAPRRVKSITIHKIFGSSVNSLRLTIMSETIIFCLLAGIVALLIVWGAESSFIKQIMIAPINLAANFKVVITIFTLLLIIGMVAGLFPAFYLTSGSDKSTKSTTGRVVRNLLLGFQYTISVLLVVVAIFMWLQNKYVSKKDLGFNYENVITAYLSDDLINKNRNVLTAKLESSPMIEDVAFSDSDFPTSGPVGSLGRDYRGQAITYNVIGVSHNFPKFMGIKVVEGNDFNAFDESSDKKTYTTWLFNNKARMMYGLVVGDSINQCEIGGITDDFNYQSLGNTIDALAFMCQPEGRKWSTLNYIYCRYNGDSEAAIELLRKTAEELDPGVSVTIRTMEQKIAKMYTKEDNQVKFISIFSLLAIIISLSGVLSLVLMEIKNRTKEVGIRKVYGATTRQILAIFNRKFMAIAIICSLIAVAPAYWAVKTWLEQYIYKIDMEWWVYVVGAGVVLLLTMSVVTLCCWQAANADPSKSVKSE